MRVAIASRIFEPEPSAASFRLGALANAFAEAGHEVTVLTVRPATGRAEAAAEDRLRTFHVKRFPVLRDRTGYVRGYLQYLSFDVPLLFRVLFGPRRDALVIEPPPTTVFLASLAARLRGIPVFAYAADVWSDASKSAGAPRMIVRAVRGMERVGWSNARGVLAVNDGVAERVRQISPRAMVTTVGNGVDTTVFRLDGPVATDAEKVEAGPYAIYTGTASEWQGAEVFVRASARLQREGIRLRLVFLGQGTAFPELERLAMEIDAPVEFHRPVPPEEAAAWLRGAAVSLASILPGAGYDFAYPTKIFAAWGCGTPVVYAGPGPARAVLAEHPMLGIGVEHDTEQVMGALRAVLDVSEASSAHAMSSTFDHGAISAWAEANVSLARIARSAVLFVQSRLGAGEPAR